jgi:transcriptional regulator with XRE-family HTH domain
VGSNVRAYRTARGMSQAELASAISDDGEHIHQQTIQKIEKGARPLKYTEALRICRALTVPVAALSEGPKHAATTTALLKRVGGLSDMAGELHQFARRLAPSLVDLAYAVGLVRVADQEDQPALFVFENAQSFLEYNWGKDLNRYLLDSIRIHPDLAELNPDLEAPTYAEVLKRVSELDLRPWQPGEIDPAASDDASET